MAMKLGPRGEALIKGRETLRLVAYRPTPRDVWTIGWGHTRGVKKGDRCTPEQAEAWFWEDVAPVVAAINLFDYELTQAMFDALCSLGYNCGIGSTATESELLALADFAEWMADLSLVKPTTESTVGNALAENRYYTAWRGISLWTKQAGKDLLGLARRRAEEMVLFFEDGLPK